MIKISFLGDLMCEPMLLSSAKIGKAYNFDCIFEHTKEMLKESDYVVANLETPLAGAEAKYTSGLFSFNTPDEIVDSMIVAGINIVVTANNHCLDRGIDGLKRTLQVLNDKNVMHTGTFFPNERNEALYINCRDKKVALISYTYGTNYADNRILLDNINKGVVNLLRPQNEMYFKVQKQKVSFHTKLFNKAMSYFDEEIRFHIKKILHMTYNVAHEDDNLNVITAEPYIQQMQNDIRMAKTKADYVILVPHVGGQFNKKPGEITDYVFKKAIDAGCDAIVASHPHVVQKIILNHGVPCAYSLGNYSMSPNSVYLLYENLPQYGLALHMYFQDKGSIILTFSILKILESKRTPLTVYPVDQLYKILESSHDKALLKRDIRKLYYTITGQYLSGEVIKKEYILG